MRAHIVDIVGKRVSGVRQTRHAKAGDNDYFDEVDVIEFEDGTAILFLVVENAGENFVGCVPRNGMS